MNLETQVGLLYQQIDKGKAYVLNGTITEVQYDAWEATSLSLLEEIFGKKSTYSTAYLKQKETPFPSLDLHGPSSADLLAIIERQIHILRGAIEFLEQKGKKTASSFSGTPALKNNSPSYVNEQRLDELTKIKTWDTSRLIRLCVELNSSFRAGNFLASGMLLRAIVDHVPPMFGVKSFSEVSNNYSGSKSFKESMGKLDSSSRKIGDSFLHTQIRKTETLPTSTQVDFSNDLDVLLAEIVRISN